MLWKKALTRRRGPAARGWSRLIDNPPWTVGRIVVGGLRNPIQLAQVKRESERWRRFFVLEFKHFIEQGLGDQLLVHFAKPLQSARNSVKCLVPSRWMGWDAPFALRRFRVINEGKSDLFRPIRINSAKILFVLNSRLTELRAVAVDWLSPRQPRVVSPR